METEAGIAHVGTARVSGHYGRLTMWVAGWALAIVVTHLATSGYAAHLGSFQTGVATLIAFALASSYAIRKRWMWLNVRAMRLAAQLPQPIANWWRQTDRLETWRMAHVILGIAVLLPLWLHIDQSAGPTRLEAIIIVAVAVLILSGVTGVIIQDFLPHAMRIRPRQEVRFEDIESALHDIYVEAEETILGRSEQLVRAYLDHIRPLMLVTQPRRRLLIATLTGADPAIRIATQLQAHNPKVPNEIATWDHLVSIAERKVRLDLNRFELHLSVAWTYIHRALATLLALLVAFHIAGAFYFARL